MNGRNRPALRWSALGVFGEVLVTFGGLLLLLAVYQLWWTNVVADRNGGRAAHELTNQWQQDNQPSDVHAGPQDTTTPGVAFARIYIPRLRDKVWGTPILSGVSPRDLAKGIGHYPSTAMPGELGNFALAGHRATNGEPFRAIDRLIPGDEVVIETREQIFVYHLTRDKIVTPNESWVIEPVPWQPKAKPEQALITLTTCNPRWASYERWIWWGILENSFLKVETPLTEVLGDVR